MTNLPEPVSSDLVTKTVSKSQLPLDSIADKIAGAKECQEMIAFWTQRLDALKAEIADALGDSTEGTIGGRKAVTYEYKDQFRGAEFAAAYPDMARVYTREITRTQLDIESIKQFQPQLYREFQVRAMQIKWKPPGDRS